MSNTCSNVSGSNLQLKVKNETEYGKSENTGFKTVFVKSNTTKFSQNSVESEILRAGRSPSKAGKGNIEVSGSIEFPFDNVQSGFWLKNALGGYEYTAAYQGAKNLHKFTIADSCLGSFQVEKTLLGSGVSYKSVGLKANELSFSFGSAEGDIIGTVGVIGKNEFMSNIQVDSVEADFVSDYNLNTKTVELVDASSFAKGEVVVIKYKAAVVATAAAEGMGVIELVDATNITSGMHLLIDNVVYLTETKSGNLVYLNRKLEKALTIGTEIFNVSNKDKIVDKVGNVITLMQGLKFGVESTTDTIMSSSKSVNFNGEVFQQTKLSFVSVDGTVLTGKCSQMTLSLNNNGEAKRFINDNGAVGQVIEGKMTIACQLTVLFDAYNADFIELAKIDQTFDLEISSVLPNGDSFKIKMPKGTISAMTPEISSPTSIEVQLDYKPFKDTDEAIIFELLNTQTAY